MNEYLNEYLCIYRDCTSCGGSAYIDTVPCFTCGGSGKIVKHISRKSFFYEMIGELNADDALMSEFIDVIIDKLLNKIGEMGSD